MISIILTNFTHEIIPLNFIDHSLGRLDYTLLSDQALMEMLFDGLKPKHKRKFQDARRNYKDISEWGRKKDWCENGRVVKIALLWYHFIGEQFPFEFIPPLVEEFALHSCHVHGTLDGSLLPLGMKGFAVGWNSLHGTLRFQAFPRGLLCMDIHSNAFFGSCVLSDLPDKLTNFDASRNKFSGEISLNALPACLKELDLSSNNLSGSITLKEIPESLADIRLGFNEFSGDYQVLVNPLKIELIEIERNHWSGTLLFLREIDKITFFFSNDLAWSVRDEEGNHHLLEQEILDKIDFYESDSYESDFYESD